ncbi:MAG: hypothetical protein AB7I79_04455 [Rhizobiaceae bacterium]
MIQSKLIAPPYLQFFISDLLGAEGPVQGPETLRIISNGVAISVPCQYGEEGETELIVGSASEVPQLNVQMFDGIIPTPNGALLFSDAELTTIMTYPAKESRTRIRIWTDGSTLPDKVVVGID